MATAIENGVVVGPVLGIIGFVSTCPEASGHCIWNHKLITAALALNEHG